MIRLMGADSGLTMATTRFADTILPNPMLISRMSMANLSAIALIVSTKNFPYKAQTLKKVRFKSLFLIFLSLGIGFLDFAAR
jgi:hypothetical protein